METDKEATVNIKLDTIITLAAMISIVGFLWTVRDSVGDVGEKVVLLEKRMETMEQQMVTLSSNVSDFSNRVARIEGHLFGPVPVVQRDSAGNSTLN